MSNGYLLIKKQWNSYPKSLKYFLLKVLAVTLLWKLSYHLILKPTRCIDVPLTNITTKATVGFVSYWHPQAAITTTTSSIFNKNEYYAAYINANGRKVIGIADPCNGLELYILYIGFLVCMPFAGIKRFSLFVIEGIAGIFILNVLRCSAMFWLSFTHNSFFDFAHHYLFKIIVYLAIFGGWVWYSQKVRNEKA